MVLRDFIQASIAEESRLFRTHVPADESDISAPSPIFL
jgi:hypothetical protein